MIATGLTVGWKRQPNTPSPIDAPVLGPWLKSILLTDLVTNLLSVKLTFYLIKWVLPFHTIVNISPHISNFYIFWGKNAVF